MRSRWNTRGDDRQDRQSPYLAAAIKYLTQNTQRPLWPGQRKKEDGSPEEPNPLYPPLAISEDSFVISLGRAFNRYFNGASPKDKRFLKYNDPGFLECFANRLNTPSLCLGYEFITKFDSKRFIQNRFRDPATLLAEKLGPIAVRSLDQGGHVQKVFPVAFLKSLQGLIQEYPSLKEDRLIVEALLKYRANLLSRHKEHLKSFGHENITTQACMDVSLAEEIQNFRAFWANRDNLLASAGS